MSDKSLTSQTGPREALIERRWLRSVIAAAHQPLPAFAWMRAPQEKTAHQKASPRKVMENLALFGLNGTSMGGANMAVTAPRPAPALFRRSSSNQSGCAAR